MSKFFFSLSLFFEPLLDGFGRRCCCSASRPQRRRRRRRRRRPLQQTPGPAAPAAGHAGVQKDQEERQRAEDRGPQPAGPIKRRGSRCRGERRRRWCSREQQQQRRPRARRARAPGLGAAARGTRGGERERERRTTSEATDRTPKKRRTHVLFLFHLNTTQNQGGWRPVRLSATDHAPQARVDPESGTLASTKGYCTARGTHGASEGTWFFEVELTALGGVASPATSTSTSTPSFYLGAARVGWATRAAELQAPVGYDKHGYAFRDREGCKVHDALREPYFEKAEEKAAATTAAAAAAAAEEGEKEEQKKPLPPPPVVKQGDVVGCYLHLPPGGRALERTREDIVSWKGGLFFVDRPEAPAAPLPGSAVAFYLNGRRLGVAFEDILEGKYYPAGSLFTPPPPRGGGGGGGGVAAAAAAERATAANEAEREKEKEKKKETTATTNTKKKKVSFGTFDAVATFNFGPRFRFPPSESPREGLPEAKPACEMAGPPP